MRLMNETLLNKVAVSGSVNYAPIPLTSIYGFSAQANIVGTIAGTLKIQASCDLSQLQDFSDVTTWTDLTPTIQTVANTGTLIWNLDAMYYQFVRFVYTSSSGSGTLTLKINAKGI